MRARSFLFGGRTGVGLSFGLDRLSMFVLLLATILVGAGMFGLSARIGAESGTPIRGSFPARVLLPEPAERVLTVPGLYRQQGLPAEVTVEHRIPVTLPEEGGDQALFIDRVRYAARVAWDDHPIGRIGELDGDRLVRGYDGSSLIRIPSELATQGEHVLSVTVADRWGEGGVLGDIRVGPTLELSHLQQWREVERIGLMLVSMFAGLVHLSVALRRPERKDRLFFALFALAFGLYFFTLSDTWFDAFAGEIDIRLRLRRFALVASLALSSVIASHLSFDRLISSGRAIVGAGTVIGLVALFGPDLRWNAYANTAADALALPAMVHYLWCMGHAVRARRPGGWGLVAAAAAGCVGVLLDLAVSRGWLAQSQLLMPAMLAVLGAIAAAISLRDDEAKDRFEALFAQARDGILLLATSGRILEANAAAGALLGRDARALFGLPLVEVVPVESAALVGDHLARARLGVDRTEFRVLGPGMERVESHAGPTPDGVVLVLLRDVTERRRLEAGLVRAARMESVGQLAGGVAHDFNNVLGGLLGQVNLLRLKFGEQEDLDARLERLERALLRATGLSRRLLTLARGGSALRQTVEVGALVDQALELIRPAVEMQVTVRVIVEPGLPPLNVVPSEIEAALLNLAVNARDAMPDGGTVLLLAERRAEGVCFCVEDEGPGVPPEERDRIFEIFYSTKGSARGTGLGLSVVQRVARDHGGQVAVRDRPSGRGARFELWIPAATGDGAVPNTGLAAPRAGGRPRVLVVDDEALICDALVERLHYEGYDVAGAPDGEAALAHFDAAPFDVLVTDVLMPGVSGIELATRLVARKADIRVVLVTGFLPSDRAWPQSGPRAWRVVEKPFRADEVVRAVADALGERAA